MPRLVPTGIWVRRYYVSSRFVYYYRFSDKLAVLSFSLVPVQVLHWFNIAFIISLISQICLYDCSNFPFYGCCCCFVFQRKYPFLNLDACFMKKSPFSFRSIRNQFDSVLYCRMPGSVPSLCQIFFNKSYCNPSFYYIHAHDNAETTI